jgi:hypothetical protein
VNCHKNPKLPHHLLHIPLPLNGSQTTATIKSTQRSPNRFHFCQKTSSNHDDYPITPTLFAQSPQPPFSMASCGFELCLRLVAPKNSPIKLWNFLNSFKYCEIQKQITTSLIIISRRKLSSVHEKRHEDDKKREAKTRRLNEEICVCD